MRTITILLCLLFCLPTRARNMDENNQIPQKDISIRFNFGIASANQEGTGESLWYSNPKKSSRGFQYGIDFLRHHKYIGYGLAFKHYMHGLSFPESAQNSSLHENIQIFYLAPQFSSVHEAQLLKGMISYLDLGIGYAHYLNKGTINKDQKYSVPKSGLGMNSNIGVEYKFHTHLGVKISISVEYYIFKHLDEKIEIPSKMFEKRSKLGIFMTSPQLSLIYHL
jgi:hypothetical protein